jgi:hypothetical protein
MHEAASFIGGLRRVLRPLLPKAWFEPCPLSRSGLRQRRPTLARMELDPEAPASSWAAWEVSRRGRRP